MPVPQPIPQPYVLPIPDSYNYYIPGCQQNDITPTCRFYLIMNLSIDRPNPEAIHTNDFVPQQIPQSPPSCIPHIVTLKSIF